MTNHRVVVGKGCCQATNATFLEALEKWAECIPPIKIVVCLPICVYLPDINKCVLKMYLPHKSEESEDGEISLHMYVQGDSDGPIPWLGWLEFGEFPWLMGHFSNYLLPKQAGWCWWNIPYLCQPNPGIWPPESPCRRYVLPNPKPSTSSPFYEVLLVMRFFPSTFSWSAPTRIICKDSFPAVCLSSNILHLYFIRTIVQIQSLALKSWSVATGRIHAWIDKHVNLQRTRCLPDSYWSHISYLFVRYEPRDLI